ncbi:MAG: AAA family ATPase [Candidatus Aenigmatarchaeota archaeon]
MIVTVSGLPGSGKTTLAKNIAAFFGYQFYSMGGMRGKYAVERGMTIDDLNELAKKDPTSHHLVDQFIKKMGEKEDNFTTDGWVSFFFIPHSVKIFLEVDPEVGARRVFRDPRPDEPKQNSVAEVRSMLEKRMIITDNQFKKYYGFDFRNRDNYDLVFDTTDMTKDQVLQKALDFIKATRPDEYAKAVKNKSG